MASVLGSEVSQLSLFRSPSGGSEPHWPAQHRCQRPSSRVAPPQQTRRPLAGSSGHREPQVPAGRRGWRAPFPAGRSLSSRRPRPAPTWLNQARLCLADLNIWIPARPLSRPSKAGPPSHQRTLGSPCTLGPQLAPQVVCLGTCPSSQHAERLRQEDRREVKANLGYEVNSKSAWPTERDPGSINQTQSLFPQFTGGKPGIRMPGQSLNSSLHLSFAESRALNPSAIMVLHSFQTNTLFNKDFLATTIFLCKNPIG